MEWNVGVIINDLINTVEMSTVSVVKSEPTRCNGQPRYGNEWWDVRRRALASSTTVVKNIIYVDKSYLRYCSVLCRLY